jgi:hypothetical protein
MIAEQADGQVTVNCKEYAGVASSAGRADDVPRTAVAHEPQSRYRYGRSVGGARRRAGSPPAQW